MKSWHSWIFLLAAPALGAEPWTIDVLLRIPTLAEPQIRPDGQAFAYVLRSIEGNAWRSSVYLAQIPEGKGRKIAAGTRPRWSPDSKLLAYLDGQVRVYDAAGGSSRAVTHAPAAVSTYAWTPDGRGIVYVSADAGPEPDPIVADSGAYHYGRLYVQSLAGDEPRKLTTANRHVISFALSPDGTRAVYSAQPTPRASDGYNIDLYELDLHTLAEKAIVAQPGQDGEPLYSPDGRSIAFHSQGGSLNFFSAREVAVVASGGGPVRYLTKGLDASFDVYRGGNLAVWSKDGKLYYTAGHSVRDSLVRQDVASGHIERVADYVVSGVSFTPDLGRAVFLKASAERPPEVTLLEGSRETRLTHVHEELAKYPAVHPQVVSWKSRDGLPVEGILHLPFGYHAGQRVPMLVELHGGPVGVMEDTFPVPRTYPTQMFLQSGIAVLQPNFRGSINYGAAFRLKNIDSQGFGDFDDVMTGVDAMIEKGIADPERLGVMGWSYGGFLSAWVIGHTDRFKAASVGAPATDWIEYYAQADGAHVALDTYFKGTPWNNAAGYEKHSPRAGVAKIRTPSLLTVGTEDINHNNEIYWSLHDRHIPVEYVVYPREPHGFVEPAHQRDLMERNLRWFTHWLASR